jgi:hypothetical protein
MPTSIYPFSDVDVDSWDFIEAPTVLEMRHNIHFIDDERMALEHTSLSSGGCEADVFDRNAANGGRMPCQRIGC